MNWAKELLTAVAFMVGGVVVYTLWAALLSSMRNVPVGNTDMLIGEGWRVGLLAYVVFAAGRWLWKRARITG